VERDSGDYCVGDLELQKQGVLQRLSRGCWGNI